LAEKFLARYQDKIEGFTLIPSSGGCFELKLDDDLVYSKVATGEFPEEETLLNEIGERFS